MLLFLIFSIFMFGFIVPSFLIFILLFSEKGNMTRDSFINTTILIYIAVYPVWSPLLYWKNYGYDQNRLYQIPVFIAISLFFYFLYKFTFKLDVHKKYNWLFLIHMVIYSLIFISGKAFI